MRLLGFAVLDLTEGCAPATASAGLSAFLASMHRRVYYFSPAVTATTITTTTITIIITITITTTSTFIIAITIIVATTIATTTDDLPSVGLFAFDCGSPS